MATKKLKVILLILGVFSIFLCGIEIQSFAQKQEDVLKKVFPIEVNIDISRADIRVDGDINDWEEAAITPLELTWANIYGMPLFEEFRRIREVSLAYNKDNLFLLLRIKPVIEEQLKEDETAGKIGYLFLDVDASGASGIQREVVDKYTGWDYHVYLEEPPAAYRIKKLLSYAEEKLEEGYGYSVDIETEEVEGGKKTSHNDPEFIAFKDGFLEMRFPFKTLETQLPSEIKLVLEDLNALPPAEIRLLGTLKPAQTKMPSEFSISYFFSSEGTYKKIEIDKSQLTYTYFKDVEGKCENWMRQEPCWGIEDLRTRRTTLSKDEINKLIVLVSHAGFMELETTYGDAGEHQRYYAHKISVKIDGIEKRVFYQSFPGASPMPEAFKKVNDKLFEFIRKKFNLI